MNKFICWLVGHVMFKLWVFNKCTCYKEYCDRCGYIPEDRFDLRMCNGHREIKYSAPKQPMLRLVKG